MSIITLVTELQDLDRMLSCCESASRAEVIEDRRDAVLAELQAAFEADEARKETRYQQLKAQRVSLCLKLENVTGAEFSATMAAINDIDAALADLS